VSSMARRALRARAARLGLMLRSLVPAPVKARLPVTLKARARALLGVEPWPDLSVRHPLFREARYLALRKEAARFDVRRPDKPVLERGHQASYLVARWFAAAGVRTAFQVGYANGRYLFYLSRMGIECGGTDLPPSESSWNAIPAGALDERVTRRLLEVDILALTNAEVRAAWPDVDALPLDVLFTEATFETMLPWRPSGATLPRYAAMPRHERSLLLEDRLPAKLADLAGSVRDILLIEPEPAAGGAGRVFEACARHLPGLEYGVWRFRPPFDRLFRLSPSSPARQVVYAYVRDRRVTDALRAYAEPG